MMDRIGAAPDDLATSGYDESGTFVEAQINYIAQMDVRAKFHARDRGRDNLAYDPHIVRISNARNWAVPPALDREGAALIRHSSAVTDFSDPGQLASVYRREVAELVQRVTGASQVIIVGQGGSVRFTERSPKYSTGMNTLPARFPHVDFTRSTAPGLVDSFGVAKFPLLSGQRVEGFNIWRAISAPPQDVPLAVCDSRTVAPEDLMAADGVYDEEGMEPSAWKELEAYVVHHNPRHRWFYFRDMQPDEVLMFRSYDNRPEWRAGVPHSAFDDPTCPPGAAPRMSVETRAVAVF